MNSILKIAILIFDNYNALDVIGPYEVLSKIPKAKIYLVAVKPGLYKDNNGLKISVEHTLVDLEKPNILVVPGGGGIDSILDNKEILSWIKIAHQSSQLTVSVCTGALLLGAAGILKGCRATTHWNRAAYLKKYDVSFVNERYVLDGKVLTSAGVTAGIDMALFLTSLIVNENFTKAVQLAIEYYPKPPFEHWGEAKETEKYVVNSKSG